MLYRLLIMCEQIFFGGELWRSVNIFIAFNPSRRFAVCAESRNNANSLIVGHNRKVICMY